MKPATTSPAQRIECLLHACYLALEEIEEWVQVMGPLDAEDHAHTFDALAALKDAIATAEGR